MNESFYYFDFLLEIVSACFFLGWDSVACSIISQIMIWNHLIDSSSDCEKAIENTINGPRSVRIRGLRLSNREKALFLDIATLSESPALCGPAGRGGAIAYGDVASYEKLVHRLRNEDFNIDGFQPPSGSDGFATPYMSMIDQYDLIHYVASIITKSKQTFVRIGWKQLMGADWGYYLNGVPMLFVSLGNPYHLPGFSGISVENNRN